MARYYRLFFGFYGGVHVVGGAVLWGVPSTLHWIVNSPLPAAVAPLLGFLSILVGLGFLAATGVTEPAKQQRAILLCGVGNLVNLAAHLQNVARGDSPKVLVLAGIVAVAGTCVFLAVLYRNLGRGDSCNGSDKPHVG